MKERKGFAVLALLAAVLFCLPVGKTSAYMTDSTAVLNTMTPGNNTTRIVEEFPSTPPQDPETNPVFQKKVQITAPSGGGINVDCYVRAKILFSNSDIGDAVSLNGTDPAWLQGNDGYYYYTKKLCEGETTAPLFTSVSIDSGKLNERSRSYVDSFGISVYEESVQAGGAKSFSDAWKEFRH